MKMNPHVASLGKNHGGRAFGKCAKTASSSDKVVINTGGHHRGNRGDTLTKRDWETRETLPIQLSLFEKEHKTEPYKAEPKWGRVWGGVGAVHSSDDYRNSTTRYSEGTAVQPMPALQRGTSDCREATNGHLNVQELQRRFYRKSKQERRYRYYSLYDKVYHPDILMEAWKRVKKNRGACGVDGYGIAEIEDEIGIVEFLEGIEKEFKERRYKPYPIRGKISWV